MVSSNPNNAIAIPGQKSKRVKLPMIWQGRYGITFFPAEQMQSCVRDLLKSFYLELPLSKFLETRQIYAFVTLVC